MKMYKCKLMGVVDSDGCYTCFMAKPNRDERMSRVLCKKQNIIQEIEVQETAKTAETEVVEAV